MATFCTKCGLEIPPDKSFCPGCGTAAHAPAPPSATGVPSPPPESGAQPPRAKKLKTILSGIPEREAKKKDSFYEKEFDSSETPETPDFEIKADQRNKSDMPDTEDPFSPAAPGATHELSNPGLLDRNPALFIAICIGIAALIAFAIISSIIVKNRRDTEYRVYVENIQASQTDAGKELKSTACDIRLKQLYRLVQYQGFEGTSLTDIKPGGCAPSGSVFFTDSISRGLLELPGKNITISLNSLTKVHITTRGDTPVITLHSGEIWVDSRAVGGFGLNAPQKSAFAGPGKFHLLSANGRSCYTPVSGSLEFDTIKGRITLTPGYQLSAFTTSSTYSLKQIDVAAFAAWVSWKDHIEPPKQAPRSTKPGAPAVSEQDYGIIESFIRDYEYEVPKYVDVSILASNKTFAIVVTKDTRPNPESVDDYWQQAAALMKNINGRWTFLEEFNEYSKLLSDKWLKKYNFTAKDEKALKLSY